MQPEDSGAPASPKEDHGKFSRLAMALADWSERWFPDALVFALAAVVIVFVIGLCMGETPGHLTTDFGEGFWELSLFTMQMAMIIIGGYVVATAPPIARVIEWLATIPRTPRGAVAFVAFVSTTASLVSWGFSLVFSALLVRRVVQKIQGVDYRAVSAAAYLGVGTVWALGLSSSAALMMASRASIPPAIFNISGLIPLKHTVFTWQSMCTAAILIVASALVAFLSAPKAGKAKTAAAFGVNFDQSAAPIGRSHVPGEWLEHNGLLTVLICAIGFSYLVKVFSTRGAFAALELNTYNFLFLMLGMLLHWKPAAFARAVSAAVPATAGVLIQFPFYAGIFGIITKSSISNRIAELFVRISSHGTYPLLIALYSAIVGLFVPSGGSKWIIEAPYLLTAANQLHVNLGWVVQIYNTAEALPNLVNPFWMLPLLGLLQIRARDVVGYTALQLIVNIPLVFFLMWFFARTLPYMPPGTP
jgi:short-chain fatty acids transporter